MLNSCGDPQGLSNIIVCSAYLIFPFTFFVLSFDFHNASSVILSKFLICISLVLLNFFHCFLCLNCVSERPFSCPFSPSPSTHLLPSSSYSWLPMMVNLFLTHLLLEVASPIIFSPPFCCHWSLRNKWLHWWRSKAYKFHMELHQLFYYMSSQ